MTSFHLKQSFLLSLDWHEKLVTLSREGVMRLSLAVCLTAFCLSAYAQQDAPLIPFDSVPNPLKLPRDLYFGEVAG